MSVEPKKALLAVGALVVLVGAALGLNFLFNSDQTDDIAGSSTTTTTTIGPTAPLTGLPEPDEEVRNRPLLAVKIDNSPKARPQFGIDKADGIVEEKVEGGISRFIALFHSQEADQVGPVRSLRTTDIYWLRPSGGLIAYSGGIESVRSLLKPAGIVDIGGDTHGPAYYKRRSDRPFEHSLYVSTTNMRTLTPDSTSPAKALYTYLDTGSTFGGAEVSAVQSVEGRMGGERQATTYAWTWDAASGKFFRTTDGQAHNVENVGQISATNVILQYTNYRATPYRDRAGAAVDEAVTTGSGDAVILSDGKVIQGRWSRANEDAITTFTDSTGTSIRLNRGVTWLQLVPPNLAATINAPAAG